MTLVNRRADRASTLAWKWSIPSRPWEELGMLLERADLFFVTTGAATPAGASGGSGERADVAAPN